jgi:predicted small lipoprotein YifL
MRHLVALMVVTALAGCGGSGSPDSPSTPPADDGSCAMTESAVPNEGWVHVAEGTTVAYQNNPPASGPHYPVWARYQSYTTPVARPYWVHNLEHGAIVLVHRPDAAPALVSRLTDTFRALPNDAQCGHARALLTPDPLLPRPVAVIAANFTLQGDCVSPDAIRRFTLAHRNQAPENICDSGTRP